MRFSPLPGVFQNAMAPTLVDHAPFFDLLDRPKAAEADKIIVQAAVSYTRGLSGGVDITHIRPSKLD
jgi:hypothetical protein